MKYAEFSLTQFDTKGLGLPDRQDWEVLPVSRSRDNDDPKFRRKLKKLGGESATVEVHRFRHWAIGWFEIILVAPEAGMARSAWTK